uniref:Uncharacterized protein n=1 Tax=Arundo donax TaxID=35708 RepID=A0A0A8ZGA7_ARUDO
MLSGTEIQKNKMSQQFVTIGFRSNLASTTFRANLLLSLSSKIAGPR